MLLGRVARNGVAATSGAVTITSVECRMHMRVATFPVATGSKPLGPATVCDCLKGRPIPLTRHIINE